MFSWNVWKAFYGQKIDQKRKKPKPLNRKMYTLHENGHRGQKPLDSPDRHPGVVFLVVVLHGQPSFA